MESIAQKVASVSARVLRFSLTLIGSLVGRIWRCLGAGALCLALSACTLSRPDYRSPDVTVGEPAFVRTLEAHTEAPLVRGNRAQILLNGD